MKLKKFNKNKKQKEILIGSIVGILLIIGGISLYRTFALYKEEKSFNVLRGRVPDFSSRDIILSYTIDKEPATELEGFPNRNSGYVVNEINCDNAVTAEWNNYNWSLENIENPKKAKQIKCNVDFRKSALNGAEPVYEGTELIPVGIDATGKVTKADPDNGWYNYDKKEWANAIIPMSNAKSEIDSYSFGQEITEDKIESYFVWIPKYSYKLFNKDLGIYDKLTTLQSKEQAIEIRFGTGNTTDNNEECSTPMLEDGKQGESGGKGNCEEGKWMTHPAFLSFNSTGFWIGKFETSNTLITNSADAAKHNNKTQSATIQIKPNVYSWRNITVGNIFKTALDYKPDMLSHMMKNTEWGAVAYLAQSLYGRCNKIADGNTTCEEISINNNGNYVTGYAAAAPAIQSNTNDGNHLTATLPGEDKINTTYNYKNPLSTIASTTKNYTGVYDLSGGVYEYVAGVLLKNGTKNIYPASSGLTDNDLDDKRFYDAYNFGTNVASNFSQRILGDATGEMGPFQTVTSNQRGSWYNDGGAFLISSRPWFSRGFASYTTLAGIFGFTEDDGDIDGDTGFRIVLIS